MPKISAEAKLETLNLYLQLRNASEVGRQLKAPLSGTAVRRRLNALRFSVPRHSPQRDMDRDFDNIVLVRQLREILQAQVQAETEMGINLPGRNDETDKVTADELMQTLNYYQTYQTIGRTAKALGLGKTTVAARLRGLGIEPGQRLSDETFADIRHDLELRMENEH